MDQFTSQASIRMVDHTLSIAPMLDWTDRFYRYFMRLISQRTLLYTEMVTTQAIIHGDSARVLSFDPIEHPVALQLGGSDPRALAYCASLGAAEGYDEINLNLGCPSERVQSGRFGACLMAEPELVAACYGAMASATSLPITIKQRIGIDERDSYGELCDFVGTLARAGCSTFIIHARKAWLQGLSPKQNREIPPLRYDTVRALKKDFPALEIVINGGITSLDQAVAQLHHVDGVMIGREAYHNPWMLAEADPLVFATSSPTTSRFEVVERLVPFANAQLKMGIPLKRITRHILGLFHGMPGARKWRRILSDSAASSHTDAGLILRAAEAVSALQRDADLHRRASR